MEVVPSVGDVVDLSVEWMVPTLVMTVPGLLLMLAVVGQALGVALFISLTRRSIGSFDISVRKAYGRPRRRAG